MIAVVVPVGFLLGIRSAVLHPATIAPGLAKPQPVTLVANPPKDNAVRQAHRRRALFVFAAERKWGGKNKKCFQREGVRVFPMPGKTAEKVSNVWKNGAGFFQSLEEHIRAKG